MCEREGASDTRDATKVAAMCHAALSGIGWKRAQTTRKDGYGNDVLAHWHKEIDVVVFGRRKWFRYGTILYSKSLI